MSNGQTQIKPPRRQPTQPAYSQISNILKEEILRGIYPAGSQLPIEQKLRDRFSVSRHTIREALRLLRDENLVCSRKKAGTVVIPPQSLDSNFMHAMSINDLIAFSRRWDFEIDTMAMQELDPVLRDWAEVGGSHQWLTIHGVATVKGHDTPECFLRYAVAERYAGPVTRLRDSNIPILEMIEVECGVTIVELSQEVLPVLLPDDVAARMVVERGTAAINVRRMCRTEEEVVLITNEFYPQSRFRYKVSLRRENIAERISSQ